MDLSKYIDATAIVDVPIRHRHCPFCNTDKNSFVVIPRRKGHLLFCHRCHVRKWVPSGKKSPSQVLAGLKERTREPFIELPNDFSNELSSEQKVWFYKYGLDDEDIQALGAGYSERFRRVVLPYYIDKSLVYWTGRFTGDYKKNKTPKYISKTKYGHAYGVFGISDTAVVVEDILSAYKIQKSGATGICIFGSYVSDELISNLSNEYSRVIIWLDPDKRGYVAKLKNRLSITHENVFVLLKPDKDPKEFSLDEIKTRINSVQTKQFCEN